MLFTHNPFVDLNEEYDLVLVYYPFDMENVLKYTDQTEKDIIENINNFSFRCNSHGLPLCYDEGDLLKDALNCGIGTFNNREEPYIEKNAKYFVDYFAIFSDNISQYEYDNYDPNNPDSELDDSGLAQLSNAYVDMLEIIYFGFACELTYSERETLEDMIPTTLDLDCMDALKEQSYDYFTLVGDLICIPVLYPKVGLDDERSDHIFGPRPTPDFQEEKRNFLNDISRYMS